MTEFMAEKYAAQNENLNQLILVIGNFFEQIEEDHKNNFINLILSYCDLPAWPTKRYSGNESWSALQDYLVQDGHAQYPAARFAARKGRFLSVITITDHIFLAKMSEKSKEFSQYMEQGAINHPDSSIQKSGMEMEFRRHQSDKVLATAYSQWQQLREQQLSPAALASSL